MVELEQAYIEWDLENNKSAKAGLFLMPVGILMKPTSLTLSTVQSAML